MNNIRASVQQWNVVSTTVILSIGIWLLYFTNDTDLFPIGPVNYGLPLTFLRTDHSGSDPIRFFAPAFVFDVLLAAVAIFSSAYTAFQWSATSSARSSAAYVWASFSFGVLLCLAPWLPWPISLLLLFMLVAVIPLGWLFCVANILWLCGKHLLGADRAGLFSLFMATLLVGMGWWCVPHDIFYDQERADTPVLVDHLLDDNPRIRLLAISALRSLPPYDKPTASAIIQAMLDSDRLVRSCALSLAPDLGESSVDAVPILVKEFIKHDGGTFELAQLGPRANQAVPALKEKLGTSDGYSKLGICRALWKIDRNTQLVVPALIQLLNHEFGPIRRDAAELLGEVGPEASDAIPLLQKVIDDVPKQETHPPTQKPSSTPAPRPMADKEFYPQLRTAAEMALRRIQSESKQLTP